MSGGADRSVWGEHDIKLSVLLFAFLGAPLAWTLHFLLAYFLVALFCTTQMQGAKWLIYASTVLFALVSAAAGWVAYREWRALRGDAGLEQAVVEAGGRVTLMLVMGIMASVLFTLLIVLEGVTPLFVPLCSVHRVP